MVDPGRVPGSHNVFVAGDDEDAKLVVTSLLRTIGWRADVIVDLGGITAARGTETYMPLWLQLMQDVGTADFNIRLVARS